jgi:hypothetical protein
VGSAGNLVALDLERPRGNDLPLGVRYERFTPKNDQVDRLLATWKVSNPPTGFTAVANGAAYVRVPPGYDHLPPPPASLTSLGDSRYVWTDTGQGDGPLFIDVLPKGYTFENPNPVPVEAKEHHGRVALFFCPAAFAGQTLRVEFSLRNVVAAASDDTRRLNQFITRRMAEMGPVARSFGVEIDRTLHEKPVPQLQIRGLWTYGSFFIVVLVVVLLLLIAAAYVAPGMMLGMIILGAIFLFVLVCLVILALGSVLTGRDYLVGLRILLARLSIFSGVARFLGGGSGSGPRR